MRYSTKRRLRGIAYSAQSARWLTQGSVIKHFWQGKVSPNENYLDVGCGGGTYAIEFFLKRGAQATLIEYDPVLRKLAEDQVSQTGFAAQARILNGDAENLELPASHFAGIQCIEVLEHLHHPAAALQGMRAAAKAGAWLVVSVPHPPEWEPNEGHVKEGYTREELVQLIESSGWKVVETRYCMLLLSRLFAWLAARGLKPHGLNWLLGIENWIPESLRSHFLPYDIVALAKAV
ncbi:MAG TPA: class I SAM-dependent methyltransferase [Chthoniobacterales bacterium]